MSASAFEFEEYAGSGRGLMARPILASNAVALRALISAISYTVYYLGVEQATGSLVVNDVMLTAGAAWDVDDDGYTFLWEAPGTLWPTADRVYRIVVTFTPVTGPAIKEVWEVTTKNVATG